MPVVNYKDKDAIAKEGWTKQAIYETISLEKGKAIYRKWNFVAETFPCRRCNSTEHVYLKSMPQGVYVTCLFHRMTSGPQGTDEGIGKNRRFFAKLLEEKEVTFEEARTIAMRLYDWGRRPMNTDFGPPEA